MLILKIVKTPRFWIKFIKNNIIVSCLFFLLTASVAHYQFIFTQGPSSTLAQEETYGFTEDFYDSSSYEVPPAQVYEPVYESPVENYYDGGSGDPYYQPEPDYSVYDSVYTEPVPQADTYYSEGETYGYSEDLYSDNNPVYSEPAPIDNTYYSGEGETYGYTEDSTYQDSLYTEPAYTDYYSDNTETYGFTEDISYQDPQYYEEPGGYVGDSTETYGFTEDYYPPEYSYDYSSDGSQTYGYTEDFYNDYPSDGSTTYGYTQDLPYEDTGGFYNTDGSNTYGYTEDLGSYDSPDGYYSGDGSQTYGYTEDIYSDPGGYYSGDGSQTYGYTQDLPYREPSGGFYNTDGSETYGYTQDLPGYYNPPHYEPVPIPAPAPGGVATVRPGGVATVPAAPGVATVRGSGVATTGPVTTTSRNFYVDYECEGPDRKTQTYYRFYSDGRREQTGRRIDRSSACGYIPSSGTSSRSSAVAQGGNTTVNVNTPVSTQTPSQTTRYPVLSTSCDVTPTNPRVGENVTWRALPSGGSGDYRFNWIGGNSPIVGRTDNPTVLSYSTSGLKVGEVRVFDNITRESSYATCRVDVQSGTSSPTPTPTYTISPTPTPTFTTYPTSSPTTTYTPTPTASPSESPGECSSASVFRTYLTGDNEVPPNQSNASAQAVLTFTGANQALINLDLNELNPQNVTAVHIHSPAVEGKVAPPTVTLFMGPQGSFTDPYAVSVTNISSDVVGHIRSGQAYINIHTAAYPDGEIRGDLWCKSQGGDQSPSPSSTHTKTGISCPAGTTERSRSEKELVCERTAQVTTTTAAIGAVCPQGTVERSRDNGQLVCEQQRSVGRQEDTVTSGGEDSQKIILTDTSQPTVLSQVQSTVKELPRTGLPLLGIGLGSLLPLGLRLKRFGKVDTDEHSASSIWMEKQLKT